MSDQIIDANLNLYSLPGGHFKSSFRGNIINYRMKRIIPVSPLLKYLLHFWKKKK